MNYTVVNVGYHRKGIKRERKQASIIERYSELEKKRKKEKLKKQKNDVKLVFKKQPKSGYGLTNLFFSRCDRTIRHTTFDRQCFMQLEIYMNFLRHEKYINADVTLNTVP
jgi:hypothetical protein